VGGLWELLGLLELLELLELLDAVALEAFPLAPEERRPRGSCLQ